MLKLIEQILKRNNKKIKIGFALVGDGSYDNNDESFKYLQKNKIKSTIRIRSILSPHKKNNRSRNREVCFS